MPHSISESWLRTQSNPLHAHPNTRGCTQDARTRALPIYSPMVVYLGRLVRVSSFQFTCCGQASTCVYACGSCIAREVDRSLRGRQATDGGSRRPSSLSQRVDSKFCQREYYKRIWEVRRKVHCIAMYISLNSVFIRRTAMKYAESYESLAT